jgi:hypothetical protein
VSGRQLNLTDGNAGVEGGHYERRSQHMRMHRTGRARRSSPAGPPAQRGPGRIAPR